MIVFLCIAVLQIFAHTVTGKSKSVNLALETVLEFDKHNLDSDVKIIDNVQKFLSKVRTVLDANRIDSRRRMSTSYLRFTDFILSCIETLKTYNDKDLQEFAESFDEEIRKYHYKGCKFYELLENNDARKIISEKIEEFRNHSPKKLKKVLHKIQKKLQNIKTEKGRAIADLINSLYGTDSQSKFKTFTDNLEAYKTKNKKDDFFNIGKIIKNGIRALIFDHYSNLNPNVRQDVKMQLNAYINSDNKANEVNDTIPKAPTKWDSQYMKPLSDNGKKMKNIARELQPDTDTDRREVESKKHKHSKQLNQAMEHDIEAEVTNKWLFEETTAKTKKKKIHRHGKHDESKRVKKHKKHKKKKGKIIKHKESSVQPKIGLYRMPPGVEERHLPDKIETPKPKTIMRVREDKPLNQILTENIAEIFIGSDYTRKAGRSPQIMNKVLPNKKEKHTKYRAVKSSEASLSELDKKDGLSIETWRRENYYRRGNDDNIPNVVEKQEKQDVKQTNKTEETTIDPYVLKKIHNLEEELLDVKKKMQEQKSHNYSNSGSSESESDSDDQIPSDITKSTKTTKTTTSMATTTAPTTTTTTTTTISTTTTQKTTMVAESSSEDSSSDSDEKEDTTNVTTTESTVSFSATSEKKPPATPTTSLFARTTTAEPPVMNTTLILLDQGKKTILGKEDDSTNQIVRERAINDDSPKDLRKLSNASTEFTTEMSKAVVITRNDVFEIKFNIKHDATLTGFTKNEPTTGIPVALRSHNDIMFDSKNVTDMPDIVDVISVLNSTMSTQDKLAKLQNLRRNIDLMSDDDPNTISKEYHGDIKADN